MIGLPNLNYKENRVSPVQLMILLSVRKDKKYGYEVIKDLREMFDGAWEPKTGVIYPAIKKLQDGGMLVSEVTDSKEYYSISPEGMEWLIGAFPTLGAMSSVVMRLAAALSEAGEELKIESGKLTDIDDLSKEEKLKALMEMRSILEKDLIKLNETIERIAGGK